MINKLFSRHGKTALRCYTSLAGYYRFNLMEVSAVIRTCFCSLSYAEKSRVLPKTARKQEVARVVLFEG